MANMNQGSNASGAGKRKQGSDQNRQQWENKGDKENLDLKDDDTELEAGAEDEEIEGGSIEGEEDTEEQLAADEDEEDEDDENIQGGRQVRSKPGRTDDRSDRSQI